MSDLKFAECNRSVFDYDKNSSGLVLKPGINASIDVPRVVNNVIDPRFIKNTKITA